MKKDTRNYPKYAEGGSVKDDNFPILQPDDYSGKTSPAQFYYNSLRHFSGSEGMAPHREDARYGSIDRENAKDLARNVTKQMTEKYGHETGAKSEEEYQGMAKGGPVKKRR